MVEAPVLKPKTLVQIHTLRKERHYCKSGSIGENPVRIASLSGSLISNRDMSYWQS
ncbi:MAG TPA: hypothetical protein PKJ95_00555 [Atribacterota bacterium]|nr:hypothetical protein [Atribacterota bacterium]